MIFGCNSENASFHLSWIYQHFQREENKGRGVRLNQMSQDSFWKRFTRYRIEWAGFLFLILKCVLGVGRVHFSAEPFLVQSHLIFWWYNLCEWVVKFDFIYSPVGGRTLEKNQPSGKCVKVIYEADWNFLLLLSHSSLQNVVSYPLSSNYIWVHRGYLWGKWVIPKRR